MPLLTFVIIREIFQLSESLSQRNGVTAEAWIVPHTEMFDRFRAADYTED